MANTPPIAKTAIALAARIKTPDAPHRPSVQSPHATIVHMRALQRFPGDPLTLVVPVVLFAAVVIAGLLLRSIVFRSLLAWSRRTESKLGELLTATLRGPAVLWVIILAFHVAATHSTLPASFQHFLHPTLEVLWLWSLVSASSRFAGRAIRLYGAHVTGAQSVTTLTEKLVQTIIVIIGVMWLLRVVFSLNLTPILTTLGVGGIAVALALQDTLSNLFAGFYVSISGLIHIGDYIRLNSGEEGFITDINWRCTTMRTLGYNLVVVPNNKLGQAIYTNYYLPEPRMQMSVSFGVGYDSDIDRVEAVLLDETMTAIGTVPGLLADPAPKILFNPGPGDWAPIFQVNFNVGQYSDQFVVQSELRKLLYKRLRKEGIELNFPTRSVQRDQKG
jgi:small-conductance mechanosensitive channel